MCILKNYGLFFVYFFGIDCWYNILSLSKVSLYLLVFWVDLDSYGVGLIFLYIGKFLCLLIYKKINFFNLFLWINEW